MRVEVAVLYIFPFVWVCFLFVLVMRLVYLLIN